jgi:hypothetical protein
MTQARRGIPWTPKHLAHSALCRAVADAFQELRLLRCIRVAMDQLPIIIDPSKDFGDTNAHLNRPWHVGDLHVSNLKPGPETYVTGIAFLQDIEAAGAVVVEHGGVFEVALGDRFGAGDCVTGWAMEAGRATVRNYGVNLCAVAAHVNLGCLLACRHEVVEVRRRHHIHLGFA